MRCLKQKYETGVANSRSWHIYKDNLRAFALHVGCPKAHDEPEDNIKSYDSSTQRKCPSSRNSRTICKIKSISMISSRRSSLLWSSGISWKISLNHTPSRLGDAKTLQADGKHSRKRQSRKRISTRARIRIRSPTCITTSVASPASSAMRKGRKGRSLKSLSRAGKPGV